jgi:hypothetical protein
MRLVWQHFIGFFFFSFLFFLVKIKIKIKINKQLKIQTIYKILKTTKSFMKNHNKKEKEKENHETNGL